MQTKLFVGGLSYSVDAQKLKEVFSEYGDVQSVNVVGEKGFGFVEMATQEAAEKAKKELNGKVIGGRALRVDNAHPQKDRGNRGRNRW